MVWCGSGLQVVIGLVTLFVVGFVVALAALAYCLRTQDPETQALTPPPW